MWEICTCDSFVVGWLVCLFKKKSSLCSCTSLRHLSEWFKVIASNPSIGDDLYTSSSFLIATGKVWSHSLATA